MRKILTIVMFLTLAPIASAHLSGWNATLKADSDAPGVFNSGTKGSAAVSPLRDIKFIASLTGDAVGNVKYDFQCDKSSNTTFPGTVKIGSANQTVFVDLTCKFPGEGEYVPTVIFHTADGDVTATLSTSATFNPTKEQFKSSTNVAPGAKTPHVGVDFIFGIMVSILAMMVYKFAPLRGPREPKPPVGWSEN